LFIGAAGAVFSHNFGRLFHATAVQTNERSSIVVAKTETNPHEQNMKFHIQ